MRTVEMSSVFEAWGYALDFLWGADRIAYPRWLRRAYILTWPIAAPLRWLLGFLWLVVGLAIFLTAVAAMAGCVLLVESTRDFADHIQKQWQ